ncbi:hypothetical protein B5S28_g2912 [[Candida] boidinii]|nr:hypothetical protein B5S28_g2912 [[Candida] boidinii]OWB62863.1 hypothetical protein B5S29_g3811 [[Candida] boidinii]
MTIDSLSGHSFSESRASRNVSLYTSSFLSANPKYYNISIDITHWQLKDLICKDTVTSSGILYPSNNSIMSLNIKDNYRLNPNSNSKSSGIDRFNTKKYKSTKLSKLYAKFDVTPRCFKEKNGVLVAGGVKTVGGQLGSFKGAFGLHIKETNYTKNIDLGLMINNSVNLYQLSKNNFKSLVCNNDHNIFLVDIKNNGQINTNNYHLPHSLNYSSLSPDYKSIAVVGDCSKIFLLHPNENLNSINSKDIIQTTYDNGFSVDWDSSGVYFSCCFQEGVNLIYDIRNKKNPLHTFRSTRPNNHSGAFRCCKFSGGTDDLLFISEHIGRVHMIDTRDFSNHQIIMLPNVLVDSQDKSLIHDDASMFNGENENNDNRDINNEQDQDNSSDNIDESFYQGLIKPYNEIVDEYNGYATYSTASSNSLWMGYRTTNLNLRSYDNSGANTPVNPNPTATNYIGGGGGTTAGGRSSTSLNDTTGPIRPNSGVVNNIRSNSPYNSNHDSDDSDVRSGFRLQLIRRPVVPERVNSGSRSRVIRMRLPPRRNRGDDNSSNNNNNDNNNDNENDRNDNINSGSNLNDHESEPERVMENDSITDSLQRSAMQSRSSPSLFQQSSPLNEHTANSHHHNQIDSSHDSDTGEATDRRVPSFADLVKFYSSSRGAGLSMQDAQRILMSDRHDRSSDSFIRKKSKEYRKMLSMARRREMKGAATSGASNDHEDGYYYGDAENEEEDYEFDYDDDDDDDDDEDGLRHNKQEFGNHRRSSNDAKSRYYNKVYRDYFEYDECDNNNNNYNSNNEIHEINKEDENNRLIRQYNDSIISPDSDIYKYCDIEITGIEWMQCDYSSSLFIGSNKGLIQWDIDSWKRRCFPSYELC